MSGDESAAAVWPPRSQWMPARIIDSPHPSVLDADVLAERLQIRFVRRGGPGGQHRNKVSTGAVLHDPVTGVSGEATESRSQRTNRSVALARLRMAAAISLRTIDPPIDDWQIDDSNAGNNCQIEQSVRDKLMNRRLKISTSSTDHPAAMALVLNDLYRAGGQPSLVSPIWRCSGGAVLRLVKSDPAAWRWLQSVRQHHGRLPLKM